mgnify:CR=1 FL=1
MNICIIPARRGSKRIKLKNIKLFFGKPMISWAIETAKKCKVFDDVIVSTDDIEIKTISEQHGAKVPFLRPSELAEDQVGTVPVIKHAIKYLSKKKILPDFVCCLYACSPFVTIDDLLNSFKIIKDKDYEFVYPVAEFPHPSYRAMKRSKNGKMEFVFPEYEMTNTQDLENTFHDVGQFYWGKTISWLKKKKMHSNGYGIVSPKWKFVDIDDIDDWKKAELLFKIKKNRE